MANIPHGLDDFALSVREMANIPHGWSDGVQKEMYSSTDGRRMMGGMRKSEVGKGGKERKETGW